MAQCVAAEVRSRGPVASDPRGQAVAEALERSEGMFRSPRMFEDDGTSATVGHVAWRPGKSLWIGTMTAIALIAGPLTATWDAALLFLVTTAVTVCLGHSLGMHRRLIHRSYQCPLWLERLFVYLGTLVGMAGPLGMIRQHDIRDWAQRKPRCHPYLAHRSPLLMDGFWQLHCELELAHPPELVVEPAVAQDPFYRWLERTWRWQQLPWAALLLAVGGWSWVVWGIAVRVAASVTGHWLVGYFAHNRGPRSWHVEGAGVQGYNVPYCGLVTMGEAWHNNHHAFPQSAKLGLRPGETDPGWWVLVALSRLGLVWSLQTPDTLPQRSNVVSLEQRRSIPLPVPLRYTGRGGRWRCQSSKKESRTRGPGSRTVPRSSETRVEGVKGRVLPSIAVRHSNRSLVLAVVRRNGVRRMRAMQVMHGRLPSTMPP